MHSLFSGERGDSGDDGIPFLAPIHDSSLVTLAVLFFIPYPIPVSFCFLYGSVLWLTGVVVRVCEQTPMVIFSLFTFFSLIYCVVKKAWHSSFPHYTDLHVCLFISKRKCDVCFILYDDVCVCMEMRPFVCHSEGSGWDWHTLYTSHFCAHIFNSSYSL